MKAKFYRPYRVFKNSGALQKLSTVTDGEWCHCAGCREAFFYNNYWRAHAKSEQIKQKLAFRDTEQS